MRKNIYILMAFKHIKFIYLTHDDTSESYTEI